MKEITTSSSLGIKGNTLGLRKSRTKWKEYLSKATVILKNNKMTVDNKSIMTLAVVLRRKDKINE